MLQPVCRFLASLIVWFGLHAPAFADASHQAVLPYNVGGGLEAPAVIGRQDDARMLSNLAVGNVWDEAEATRRFGKPAVTMSSTLSSRLIWIYRYREGMVISVDFDTGTIIAIEGVE